MDMERLQAHRRQFARATVAYSVLDYIAVIFLAASFAFWGVLYWQLFRPASIFSLSTVTVVVLALVYSLAAPLLLSMLVPTTPAGQLLQKTQWATVGFPVIIASALYLVYQGFTMIDMWLQAQGGIDPASGLPVIAAAGQNTRMALSLMIAFVIIPALAWVQTTPERWMAQIHQAHAVKKLETQQRGELAIIKASLVRAETLAAIGWAGLLPVQRAEVFNTMRGLLMGSADTMRSIVRTLGISSDLERTIMSDDEIANQLDYVAQAIDVVPEVAAPALPAAPREIPAEESETRALSRSDAAPASPHPRPASVGNPAPPQSAAVSGSQPQYAAEYHAARQRLDGVWSSSDLGEVIGRSPRSALERIYAWISVGLVQKGADGKGTYYFTESEVR